ncbi:MAG TPA: carbamoyl phosphate synthase large subunit [Elusimicrobia bacterium]|nr:MAG: carbamoyl phosphate synthase large subunit [Elusimicrobia bacterium RIFOXYA12_FULL_49_49]OGS15508.1 MAG: carbamoyl phosphate synthase large subunit [Elusimicrobia bacterium RIFOXYA2_FULL_47_53]OGS30948.1 MAG: carbamoyl phosphate synthase large subunit [Elusimicrobia bacterium RIFOXYB2_FULL_46_23]HBU69083.1 carbamoyl phosphate synthase large subunit [Elusimicrobiota bacterium]
MPKRTDIKKILIIGSGPIVIGQACEFDYSGTQAIKALRKEGYKIVLVNSNPATIMTDPEFADATYIEPLAPDVIEKIIEKERPEALLPTLGGQTALNLAVALSESGVLKKYNVELIGAKLPAIQKAEDRRLFRRTMQDIGLDLPQSGYAYSLEEALKIAEKIGFPLIIRPSFTLGGIGSGTVYTREELLDAVSIGLDASPIGEILVEESVLGWKEFELEVMRDCADNCVVICSIENFDPMGVHTGDSITVAPAQTLTDKEYQKMRDWAFKVIRAIGVDTGGSNIQFAVNPKDGRIVVIEMNPRVSRSSALASKATGFPIAKIASLLAVGYRLDEVPNDITKKTPASFEPTIDYCVVKIPRFAFEKFTGADQTLNTAMKSVGEVMSLGRTFKEAVQKAVRGLEVGRNGLSFDGKGSDKRVEAAIKEGGKLKEEVLNEVRMKLNTPNCERIFNIMHAFQLGLSQEDVISLSKIDPWFIQQIYEIFQWALRIPQLSKMPPAQKKDFLYRTKQFGFSDQQIAYLTKQSHEKVRALRNRLKVKPSYKLVDTCAAEFEAYTPYYYSTYEQEDEVVTDKKKKVMILGAGPNRIGQGIEFDYCCVHAVMSLKDEGYETIMVNCNPETVSTDYDISDRLYFEPLTAEDVLNIIEKEKPMGVVVQFGGQTPLNLTPALDKAGVKILGTSPKSIDTAEDRKLFSKILDKIKIPQAASGTAFSFAQARDIAHKLTYPVMVRPSYVLGGRGMKVVYDDNMLSEYINQAAQVSPDKPILIDKFLDNAIEVDVDALSDGKDVYIAGIMEHIEEAGIHSGDSACVIPPNTLSPEIIATIKQYTTKLAVMLQVKGLMNIQFAVKDGKVYILEANPRASRTIPYVSKATGLALAKLAAKVMVGKKLKNIMKASSLKDSPPKLKYVAVKEVVLPWTRFSNVDVVLGPEMKSTGEVMGIDSDFGRAFAKAEIAAGSVLPRSGAVLVSLGPVNKAEALPVVKELLNLGFEVMATTHTAEFFAQHQLPVTVVNKISEGRPNVVDIIKNKKVSLIINTPSGKVSRADGYHIRRSAVIYNIPILTTLAAARATVEGIKSQKNREISVHSLQEYYKK